MKLILTRPLSLLLKFILYQALFAARSSNSTYLDFAVVLVMFHNFGDVYLGIDAQRERWVREKGGFGRRF